MADSFTANLNLRKPEVGAAHDTWGGLAGLNGDLDLIDALFLATGLGTSVGLHVGTGKVANIEGTLLVADPADTSAAFMFDASDITTATIRTLKAPDASGTIALKSDSGIAQTGDIKQGIWAAAPAGWVLADGRTIGSAASGASSRAHADCEALFSLVWTQFPAALIYTFEGIASTRGADAAADFAANKRLTMFDARGRVLAGLDNMGGTIAGILGGYTTMGVAGGEQTHVLTMSEMAQHNHGDSGHTHGASSPGHAHSSDVGGGTTFITANSGQGAYAGFAGGGLQTYYSNSTAVAAATVNVATGYANLDYRGSNTAHNNIQPTVAINIAVKL